MYTVGMRVVMAPTMVWDGDIGTVRDIIVGADDTARYGVAPDNNVFLIYYREDELRPVSWKVEVLVDGQWSTNSVRFATQEEAELAGQELLLRWFVPKASRAAESADPVNYLFNRELFRPEAMRATMQ